MGLTKPIEQNLLSYKGTFIYLKYIIRASCDKVEMKKEPSLKDLRYNEFTKNNYLIFKEDSP